jgi:hypothetical protein
MRALRLVALSDDGQSLILAPEDADPTEDAERFELAIDERVRAAARGDARLGQIQDVGNTLPPRVIQARIRAGETPEQVAQASGTRVERIMRFAHPVLQERARIAEQAQEARVRLSEGTPTVPLRQFMSQRLRLLGGDLDGVRWDAHRGDDGTWQVTAAWRAEQTSGVALWAYDIPARTVTPLDATTTDFAEGTRLVRVVPDVPGGGDGGVAAPGDGVVPGPVVPPQPRAVAVVRKSVRPDGVGAGPAARCDEPATPSAEDEQAYLDQIAEHDTVVLGRQDEIEDPRARIPAWEDIVFGVRRNT